LQEDARVHARLLAEKQREVGARPLHDAAYDLARDGADGTSDDESSPAAQVLESHARGRALHAPARVATPDPATHPSAGTNGATTGATNGAAPS
ncbi:MAG: hypothetical protein OXI03_10155, partial [Chloroflexota bacterium]|nr:hypothetical protein [Chloroflexota bacterium]